jgi:hypothetical protein
VTFATHVVAFTPIIVSLREAKLFADRICLLVLLADRCSACRSRTGEEEIEVLNAGAN